MEQSEYLVCDNKDIKSSSKDFIWTLQYDPARNSMINSLTYVFILLRISCNFGKFQH